jgi:hypothetical protein
MEEVCERVQYSRLQENQRADDRCLFSANYLGFKTIEESTID